MSKPQRLREAGQCAYCGQHDILTVDHVIPRCLFDGVTGGVPSDVPKVGACRRCNNAKSTDDTFLRDVLVRDLRLAEHPLHKASGKVLMSVPSSEESLNILAPLHTCGLCPHRLVQG